MSCIYLLIALHKHNGDDSPPSQTLQSIINTFINNTKLKIEVWLQLVRQKVV
jgi:hypothetical protein